MNAKRITLRSLVRRRVCFGGFRRKHGGTTGLPVEPHEKNIILHLVRKSGTTYKALEFKQRGGDLWNG